MTSQPQVLVVDDDGDVRRMMLQVLSMEGVSALGAANGAEALALLRAGVRPSIVFLDLMMPVMNGWEFVTAQRADPALREIPVVVLSADSNTTAKAAELGVHGSLRKPVDLDELLAMVPGGPLASPAGAHP